MLDADKRLFFVECEKSIEKQAYDRNHSHLDKNFMNVIKLRRPPVVTPMGLHQLACNTAAEVVGMNATYDDEERSIALRLLEIGFLPGESVRVIAHGFPGHDPLAVRIGHTTFALRSHEAALVQVRLIGQKAELKHAA